MIIHLQFKTLFYLVALAAYIYTIIETHAVYGSNEVKARLSKSQSHEMSYYDKLTFWCLLIQPLYYIANTMHSIKSSEPSFYLSWLWVSVAFPISCTVSLAFWAIFRVDETLLIEEEVLPYIPRKIHHLLHTVPMIFQILEAVFIRHERISIVRRFTTTLFVSFSYLVSVLGMHHFTSYWAYPLLVILVDTDYYYGFIGLFAALLYTGAATMVLGARINSYYHYQTAPVPYAVPFEKKED